MKTCTKCQEAKTLLKFYRDKSRRDGYKNQCIACDNARAVEWQRRNPDKVRETWQRRSQRVSTANNLAKYGTPTAPRFYAGDDICYSTAHSRVQCDKGRAREHKCADCGVQACDWSYIGGCDRELEALVSDQRGVERLVRYSPNPGMYEARCKSCHLAYDRRST